MNYELLDTYPKYDDYQDSGIDWLGDIPEGWSLLKVRNIFRLSNKFAGKNNSHELLSVYTDIGVKPRRELEARGNKASTTDGYLIVEKGDIVVNKLLAWMGAIGYSNYDGVTSPAYDILKAYKPVNAVFYHYLFRDPRCVSELKRHSRGIMNMRLRLYFDRFGDILVPYPPLKVQNNIVDFLTRKNDQIDEAIFLTLQQIKKLEEYKVILIEQAITKGIDSDCLMKDSELDWIKSIPKHWNLTKFKHLFKEVNQRSVSGTETLLSVSQYTGITKRADNISNGIITNAESLEGYKLVQRNQLVINIMLAWNGSLAFSDYEGIVSPAYSVYKIKADLDYRFFDYLLRSETYKAEYKRKSRGVVDSRLRLYTDDFYSIWCSFPNKKEQVEIANYLDEKTAIVNQAINQKLEQAERLKEYKTILINQAVTGKIKVS